MKLYFWSIKQFMHINNHCRNANKKNDQTGIAQYFNLIIIKQRSTKNEGQNLNASLNLP